MGYYVNKLAQLLAEAKRSAETTESAVGTVAIPGRYNENKNESTVTVNGYDYPCAVASLDLNLVDGCRVMVIPDSTGGNMVIVGGGLP